MIGKGQEKFYGSFLIFNLVFWEEEKKIINGEMLVHLGECLIYGPGWENRKWKKRENNIKVRWKNGRILRSGLIIKVWRVRITTLLIW